MKVLKNPALRLKTLLWLIAIHSAGVGLGLIFHPAALLTQAGYAPVSEPFFPVQGGVFHLVMAVGYSMAAWDPRRHRCLIVFSVAVKTMATIFLVLYWLLAAPMIVILASGLMDGAMALVLILAYRSWRRSNEGGLDE